MLPSCDIGRVRPGDTVKDVFLLVSKDKRKTKAEQPFLVVVLRNASGDIGGKVWSEHVGLFDSVPPGSAIHVTGRIVDGWKGAPPEVEVHAISALPTPHPIQDLMNPRCGTPLAELEDRFAALTNQIHSAGHQMFVQRFFEVACSRERYFQAPAASFHHHNYLHGLAEHSIEVAEISMFVASLPAYEDHVDRDSLIVGALLHDTGKLEEIEWEGVPIRQSPLGRFAHHIPLGIAQVQLVRKMCGEELRMAGMTDAHIDHIIHIQQSHHGLPEWGSYYEPRSVEAIIIHGADLLSSRPRAAISALDSATAEGDGWFGGMHSFRRGLFVPTPAHMAADHGRMPSSRGDQGSLLSDLFGE